MQLQPITFEQYKTLLEVGAPVFWHVHSLDTLLRSTIADEWMLYVKSDKQGYQLSSKTGRYAVTAGVGRYYYAIVDSD